MLYGWTPDYVLSRLTFEDAVRFAVAGARLNRGEPVRIGEPGPSVPAEAPRRELGTYQEPDRMAFQKIARGIFE